MFGAVAYLLPFHLARGTSGIFVPTPMTYAEKLKDPRWQQKRLQIMDRDEWTCRHCGTTTDTLTVHHTVYWRNREPWDYNDDELITLCEQCHREHEKQKGEFLAVMGGMPARDVAFITTILLLTHRHCDHQQRCSALPFYELIIGVLCDVSPEIRDTVSEENISRNALRIAEMLDGAAKRTFEDWLSKAVWPQDDLLHETKDLKAEVPVVR